MRSVELGNETSDDDEEDHEGDGHEKHEDELVAVVALDTSTRDDGRIVGGDLKVVETTFGDLDDHEEEMSGEEKVVVFGHGRIGLKCPVVEARHVVDIREMLRKVCCHVCGSR